MIQENFYQYHNRKKVWKATLEFLHALALAVVSLKVSWAGRLASWELQVAMHGNCHLFWFFVWTPCINSVTYLLTCLSVCLSLAHCVDENLNLSSNGFTVCDCDVLAVSRMTSWFSDMSFANRFRNRFFSVESSSSTAWLQRALVQVYATFCSATARRLQSLHQTLMHCNSGPWVECWRSLSPFKCSLKTVSARDMFAPRYYILQVTCYTYIICSCHTQLPSASLSVCSRPFKLV